MQSQTQMRPHLVGGLRSHTHTHSVGVPTTFTYSHAFLLVNPSDAFLACVLNRARTSGLRCRWRMVSATLSGWLGSTRTPTLWPCTILASSDSLGAIARRHSPAAIFTYVLLGTEMPSAPAPSVTTPMSAAASAWVNVSPSR